MKKVIFTLSALALAGVSNQVLAQNIKATYTLPTVVHILTSEVKSDEIEPGIKNINRMMQGYYAKDTRRASIMKSWRNKIAGLDVELKLASKYYNADEKSFVDNNNGGIISWTAKSLRTEIGASKEEIPSNFSSTIGNLAIMKKVKEACTKKYPTDKYLNIYIFEQYNENRQSGMAFRPGEINADNSDWNNSALQDGIMLSAKIWPDNDQLTNSEKHIRWTDNDGRRFYGISAHEVGHYLNLIHPFGSEAQNNGVPADTSTIDDGVADTPSHALELNGMTEDPDQEKNNKKDYKAINQADNKDAEGKRLWVNLDNFMTYSANQTMFTQGQVERMEAALSSSVQNRKKLWSYQNLVNTGVIASNASKYPVVLSKNQLAEQEKTQALTLAPSAVVSKEWIKKVTLTEENKKNTVVFSKTSEGDNRYEDFSKTSYKISKDKSYSLSVDLNDIYNGKDASGVEDHTYVAAWIDWNQNGAFENSEKIDLWSPGQSVPYIIETKDSNDNSLKQGLYTELKVPANAKAGKVRLRVRSVNNNYAGADKPFYAPFSMSPGGNDLFGEVEDYTLNIASENSASRVANSNEAENSLELSLSPIPVIDQLQINYATTEAINSLEIFDALGNLVITADKNAKTIDVSALSVGVYTVVIKTESTSVNKRFIKK